VEAAPVVLTVEEGCLDGSFGSALLEAANTAGLDARHIVRLGIPDRFVQHAERGELLTELGLDAPGICAAVRQALGNGARRREVAVGE
jgi:1-deoxy-D-xylulose-5-phosphate synthase